jgi:hypothetical protein
MAPAATLEGQDLRSRLLLPQGPTFDPHAGLIKVRHRGPGVLDYHPSRGLFDAEQRVKPWHSLPKKWPEFAKSTLVASGGRFVPFDPFSFQIDLVRLIMQCQNVLVLKSRQTGISETIISYMLSNAIRKPAWTGVVFSKTGDDASELAARIKGQASTLRERCPPLPKDSMRKLVFQDAGSLHFLPPTERAARGIPSASFILFDEAAFIEKLPGIETGALPTLSMLGDRGRAVWCTTPNGRSGRFSDHWETDHGEVVIDPTPMGPMGIPRIRVSPDKTWAKICIHYSEHPVYSKDPEWAAKTKKSRQLTDAQFAQEYELDFTASDFEIFKHELIADAEAAGMLEPPVRGRSYYLGIDPNGGGNDQFCGIILDATDAPWRVVAGFAEANCSRDYGLRRCAQLIDQYRPDLTCVEKNGVGANVAEALGILRPGYDIEEISTTEPSKVYMTDRLVLLFEQHEITIPPDWFLGAELRTFRQDPKGKRAAAAGKHDDAVMALAMAGQAAATRRPMDSSWIRML